MRNLKRVLALVLALTMVLSFAISASAGAFTDVKDEDDYASAINLLAALEVLKGFEDGTYNSAGSYTREQFAKILYVLVNGKDDGASMYTGTAPFPDVAADRWSAGYITWAVNLGICNGRDDGNFWPTDVVKYAEACKMILIAMGYSSTIYTYPYGFIDKASTLKLFDDVTGYTTFGDANRGSVAQMAYNALFADAPRFGTYTAKEGESTSTKTKLLIMGAFGVTYDYGILEGTSTNAYKTGVYGDNQIDVDYYSVIKDKEGVATNWYGLDGTFNYTGDVDALIGMTAKIWYKTDENALGNMKIYLVEDSNKDKAYTINPYDVDEIDDTGKGEVAFKDGEATRRLKVGGAITPIKWDGNDGAVLSDATGFDANETNKGITYKVIDRGNDGKIDTVYEIEPDFAKITALSDTRISMSTGKLVGSNNIKSGDNTVVSVFTGAAKDDYALVYAKKAVVGTSVKSVYDVVKAEAVENVKYASKTSSKNYFGGTAYSLLGTAGNVELGKTYDLFLNANGYVAKAVLVKGAVEDNFILVVDANNYENNVSNAEGASASYLTDTTVTGYLADGTKKTLYIDFDEIDVVGTDASNAAQDDDQVANNANYFDQTDGFKVAGLGKIYAYTLGTNGRIDYLIPLQAYDNTDVISSALDVDTDAITYDEDKTKLTYNDASSFITDSTLIYNVYEQSGALAKAKVAVIKGSDLPKIASGVTGVDYIGVKSGNVAVVALKSTAKLGATSDKYGLVISATEFKNGSKYYYEVKAAVDGEIKTLTTTEGNRLSYLLSDDTIGYYKLTMDAAGKIKGFAEITYGAECNSDGEHAWVQGAVTNADLAKGLELRGGLAYTYDTVTEKVYLTGVAAAANNTVYLYADDVAFYTVDKAPYVGLGLATKAIDASTFAKGGIDNVIYANDAKINAGANGSLLDGTSIDKVAGTVTKGDVAYAVDVITTFTDADKLEVVAVFIYTTPISGNPDASNAPVVTE